MTSRDGVRAGRSDLKRMRRCAHEQITVDNTVISVRDQAPLHEGNLKLPTGYTFEELIESLNSRLFFWPGTAAGPISYGVRHFERYKQERPVIIRTDLQSLLSANPAAEPSYCAYNSGSPRCSNGRKSPRGPDTFLPAAKFAKAPTQVVEASR
jgi:hypothetical protein